MPETALSHDAKVRINGAELPRGAQSDLHAITVQEDLEAPSMFTFDLYNWDGERLRFSWSDDELFAPGNEVEIWLGYLGALQKVMRAEITSLEPSFQADEPPTLTVRGYDHRHRLLRGSRTRSFTKMKDSDIARQIARETGLLSKVTDSRTTHDYVLQYDQADLDFLQERAARIGYEVFVQDKALYFRPQQNTAKETMTLSLEIDITEFQPRLTTITQVGEIVVRGWDPAKKQAIVAKASAGQELTTMGGRISGPRGANKAFGKSTLASVAQAVVSDAEAGQMAVGQFNGMALAYIGGEVVCSGKPDLHPGTVVRIEGAGNTFSGLYYVSAVTHSISEEEGYQTRFSVRRNAT